MPNEPRWSLYIEQGSQLDLFLDGNGQNLRSNNSQEAAPVMDTYFQGKLMMQLGLNVPHLPHDPPLFTELAGNSKALGISYNNEILLNFLWIMFNDSSVSSFTFSRLNKFRINLSDSGLIKILEIEANTHKRTKAKRMLARSDYNPNVEILEEISKNPPSYNEFLYLSGENAMLFHYGIIELAKGQEEKAERGRELRTHLEGIKEQLKYLEERKVRTTGLRKEIDKAEKEAKTRKPVSADKLERIYESFCKHHSAMASDCKNNGVPEYPSLSLFSNVVLMSTTLHERANKGYSQRIVTFEVTEPFREVECDVSKKMLGYEERRKMINQQ